MPKNKRNNKGISLVELIIAIAILSIIVLPLLRAFIISTKTNANAKQKQRANEIAQNILEGFIYKDIEEVANEFNYPEGGNNFNIIAWNSGMDTCEMLPTNAGDEWIKAIRWDDLETRDQIANPEMLITSSVLKTNDEYKFLGQNSHKYYFSAKNISSDGADYDALITVDAKTNADNTLNKEVNNEKVANLSMIDTRYDAISASPQKPDTILQNIKDQYKDALSDTFSYDNVKRTILVDISKASMGSSDYTLVRVSYKYEFMDKYGNAQTFPNDATIDNEQYEDVIYENADETDKVLKNIYLFYYPWYTTNQYLAYDDYRDNIIIDNQIDENVNILAVTQEFDTSSLSVDPSKYTVLFTIKENNLQSRSSAYTTIKTNLFKKNKASYFVNGVYCSNEENALHNKLTITNLSENTSYDRLFDVNVKVYPKGAADQGYKDVAPLISMDGGMIN